MDLIGRSKLLEEMKRSRKYPSSDWAKAFNSGLFWAMDLVEHAETVPAQYVPPNDPLTLDQLREMDGEPVWCKEIKRWGIVMRDNIGLLVAFDLLSWCADDQLEKLTLYRRKPEEG